MAFEGLTEKLQGALRKLSSKGKLTEDNEIGRASCRERV